VLAFLDFVRLLQQRMIRLTGCQLVVRDLRLLPTEFVVIVLTESDRYRVLPHSLATRARAADLRVGRSHARAYIRTKFVDSLRTITLDKDSRASEPVDMNKEYHIFVKVLLIPRSSILSWPYDVQKPSSPHNVMCRCIRL
jgi:hypothetical protein